MNPSNILTSALTAAVVVVVMTVLVGGNQPDVGGTRFPNGISVDGTSPSSGELRSTTLTTTGAATISGVASLQAESNKIGSANSYNPLYFGAGDGCAALLASASGTLTTTATSTSFCNS